MYGQPSTSCPCWALDFSMPPAREGGVEPGLRLLFAFGASLFHWPKPGADFGVCPLVREAGYHVQVQPALTRIRRWAEAHP